MPAPHPTLRARSRRAGVGSPDRRPVARRTMIGSLLVGLLAWWPSAVSAHTDFEASVPADGDVVGEPVAEVTLTFSGAVTPAGGFVALDGDGTQRPPEEVTAASPASYVLRFDPPLAGGAVGIRWDVRAEDGHSIAGAVTFRVAAPGSAATKQGGTSRTTAPGRSTGTAAPSRASAPPTTATERSVGTEPAAVAPSSPTTVPSAAPEDDATADALEAFLEAEPHRPGRTLGLVGRILSLLGVVGVVGGMAFLATTLVGSRREVDGAVTVLRALGAVVAVGALSEYAGLVRSGEGFADAWTSTPGVAMVLRVVGGVLVAVGLRRVARPMWTRPRTLSAAVVDVSEVPAGWVGRDHPVRWLPRSSPAALVGGGVLLVSFWFDGHTVTAGWRPLLALVDTIHVAAGAVWVGGVVGMCALVWARRRRGVPGRGAELVVRFSSVATVALVAVIAAGVAMAITVLDSPAELVDTEWGQLLLLKTGAVVLAVGAGAYNHLRLRPALRAAPHDALLAAELRRVLLAEAIMLVFVVVVTAWLVAAAI